VPCLFGEGLFVFNYLLAPALLPKNKLPYFLIATYELLMSFYGLAQRVPFLLNNSVCVSLFAFEGALQVICFPDFLQQLSSEMIMFS
jgi:hypothetical protein